MRRFITRLLLGTLAVVALYFSAIGIQQYVFGNVHAVIEGELYRSAQLTPEQITTVVKAHGIKSILNLRGDNTGSPWYDNEVAATKALGIAHLNYRMKSSRDLTDTQVKELIAAMKDAPKPVLIHCHAGADRTGLASALYLYSVKHVPPAQASRALSLRYGHMPFYYNSSYAMDRTFARVVGAQGQQPAPAPVR